MSASGWSLPARVDTCLERALRPLLPQTLEPPALRPHCQCLHPLQRTYLGLHLELGTITVSKIFRERMENWQRCSRWLATLANIFAQDSLPHLPQSLGSVIILWWMNKWMNGWIEAGPTISAMQRNRQRIQLGFAFVVGGRYTGYGYVLLLLPEVTLLHCLHRYDGIPSYTFHPTAQES